jgi:hypothetical protein
MNALNLRFDLSDKLGQFPYCRFAKKMPEIHDFGRNGTEVKGMEIKVKFYTGTGSSYYGPAEFQREFVAKLAEKDIRSVLELIPGRVLYANLPCPWKNKQSQ